MKILLALAAILAASLVPLVVAAPRADAACGWLHSEHMVDGAVELTAHWACDGAAAESGTGPSTGGSDTSPVSESEPPRDSGWDPVCVRTAIAVGLNVAKFCDLPPATVGPATPAPTVTPDLVGRAFRRLPLPASELEVQPPDGQTLVNFDTNFFTRQGQFTRTVRLLGQRVDLKIWPSQYRWVFGDGESLASEGAGAPYPDLQITHDYRSKGGVSPRVDTTYSAQFRVNGGAWRDVDGTVTIPGAPVQLRVRTATPVLVGYH